MSADFDELMNEGEMYSDSIREANRAGGVRAGGVGSEPVGSEPVGWVRAGGVGSDPHETSIKLLV